MTRGRGRGRGSTSRVSKVSVRGRGSTSRINMPNVPIPTISSQQDGRTSSSRGPTHINQVQTLAPTSSLPVQTSGHASTSSVRSEPAPVLPNQSNGIGEDASSQDNTIGEGENNSSRGQRTFIFLSPSGLLKRVEIQHRVSYICTFIHMVTMKIFLLVSEPESCMKNMKKYYNRDSIYY